MGTYIADNTTSSTAVEQQLDREVELIGGAIRMVASGASSAMTVAGIRFGEQAIRVSRQQASLAGVTVTPLWHLDDTGCDVRITPAAQA